MLTIIYADDAWEFCCHLVSRVESLFRLQKTDAYSIQDMHRSIMRYVTLQICVSLRSKAFCDLSNSVIRYTNGNIGAIVCRQLHLVISMRHFFGRFGHCWSPIVPIFFFQPKNFFKKFSSRPTRQRPYSVTFASFHTFCFKSSQNG